MSFESRDYLHHIRVEVDYLVGHSAGLTYEAFAADETLRRAFVRRLEMIGEAAKKIPDDSRRILHWNVTEHPTAEWTIELFRAVITPETSHRFVLHDRDSICR